MTGKISVTQIKDRQQFLNSTNEATDASNLFNIAYDAIENNKQNIRESTQDFFHACENKYNANLYFTKCLDILESVKKDSYLSSILENNFCSRIVPYIKDIDLLRNAVSNRKLNESTTKAINEAADIDHICDRILSNNAKLSKRFNFDKYIKENAYKPIEDITLTCCEMIDTYSAPTYAKVNIALEELSYILQKNMVKYDSSRMTQIIAEYFISFGKFESKDEIRKVLTENYCIDENDLSRVKFIMEDFAEPEGNNNDNYNPYDMAIDTSIIDKLNECIARFNQFKVNNEKTIDDLMVVLDKNADDMVVYQIQYVPDFFDWLRNFGISLFEDKNIVSIVNKYMDNLIKQINGNRKYLENLSNVIQTEMAKKRDNDEHVDKIIYDILSKYQEEIDISMSTMATLSEQTFYANRISNEKTMTLNEFKIFKFDNIIKYALLANKKLKEKEKLFMGKVKGKVSELFKSGKKWLTEDYDIAQAKNENIYDCISYTDNFDHVLAVYEVSDIQDIPYMNKQLSNFCSEMNELSSDPEIRLYYTNIDNLFEIHIADTCGITLTEEENEECSKVFTETEQLYAGYLMKLIESLDDYENIDTASLAEDFHKIESTLTADGIVGIIEASKYLVNLVPYARLQEISDVYAANHPMDYRGNTAISQALNNWKLEECNLDMVVETVALLRECVDSALLTEAEDKSKVKQAVDNAKENIKKIEKTKFNFNTLKYAMEDLKVKSRNAGDKAQQFSQTLNIYVEKFITSIQKLYTNNDREQIIRGSIIPSFHQLMGRLLIIGGAAGVGGIAAGSTVSKVAGVAFGFSATGAIFTAALGLFVTIAISKHSTDKERALMLDEIEIEIDICDKEMQKAEANGQMKKYRALMYRSAKLKREYQRIKYNIGYKELRDLVL